MDIHHIYVHLVKQKNIYYLQIHNIHLDYNLTYNHLMLMNLNMNVFFYYIINIYYFTKYNNIIMINMLNYLIQFHMVN